MAPLEGQGQVVGKIAPDFTLRDQNHQAVQLYKVLENGPTLLAFYPGDFTPICTKQLCNYSDNIATFKHFGMQILGISANTPDSHAKFVKKYNFPFPLLADPNKVITKTYGCQSLFMLGKTSRAVFIVSPKRLILYRYVEPTVLTHKNAGELALILQDMKSHGVI